MTDLPDELFSLKNAFYIGHFSQVLQEAASVRGLNDVLKIEKDVFVYRAKIGLGQHSEVISCIPDNVPVALLAVKLYAVYISQPSSHATVLATLRDLLGDSKSSHNPTLQLIAGYIYLSQGDVQEALKVCRSNTSNEMQALTVQCLLLLDRVDLAVKTLQTMQEHDDDATLTHLAQAWVNIANGQFNDACLIYQELIDKFQPTSQLLTGLASALMMQGKHNEAERALLEANQKNPADADVLLNLITNALHLKRPGDVLQRYMGGLRQVAPSHPCFARMEANEQIFDKVAASLTSV